jgi:hypothetical protein
MDMDSICATSRIEHGPLRHHAAPSPDEPSINYSGCPLPLDLNLYPIDSLWAFIRKHAGRRVPPPTIFKTIDIDLCLFPPSRHHAGMIAYSCRSPSFPEDLSFKSAAVQTPAVGGRQMSAFSIRAFTARLARSGAGRAFRLV